MNENSELHDTILPGGTVTFLFTDIEGSTLLLQELHDEYATLLADHHLIIRQILTKWNGREVDTQGDAFFAAFPKATEAVAAVVDLQRALAEHTWPGDAQVQVRMGLHTGEPWLVEQGYVGMDVHRAARIGHAGHGGQVLLSETTTALVQDELPEGISLRDLGRHRLKDMRRPESIHQLVIEGLQSQFPPLKSLEVLPIVEPGPPGAVAAEPRQVGDSPYRGLAAFRESDASLFFGREAFTNQLAEAVRERGLVAVIVGPSGSGKSSAVFAGLLPQLRESQDWLIVELRPGSRPFHALAGALAPTLEGDLSETDHLIEIKKLAHAMKSGELSLFQVTNRALERHPSTQRLLLVIDQFEELFTQRPDPEAQRLFLDELLAAAESGAALRRSPLVLLLTLRADFMGQALTHRPFADALQEGSLILGPMNRDELQAAVEKPAELQGAAFEAGLVQRILDDVGEEPGNLPLLEFALTLLWERLDQGWLTHAAYEEIGRVDGALARYAEEVWTELDVTEREAARRLFVQLVQPGEGTEDTRRVARRGELAPGHWSLVQHLADQRLVVTGRDQAGDETVEVVHEALIRSWDRLRTWMQADRSFRTWQEGLRVAQRGWEASGRDEGALLRGAPLAMALEWSREHEALLSQPELEFIETSQQESQRRAAEEEARRQRELETAQQLAEVAQARAEEQAQSAARLRRRALFLGAVMVVAALLALAAVLFARQSNQNATLAGEREALALEESHQRAMAEAEALKAQEQAQAEAQTRATAEAVALVERDNAEQQTRLTRSRELALESAAVLQEDPELSILLALEGLAKAYTKEAEQALHQGVLESRLRMHLVGETGSTHGESVSDLALSPDGSRIATADSSGYVNIWDATSGESLLVKSNGEHFRSLAYSPDGERLALASRVVDITTIPLEGFDEQLEHAGTSKVALWDAKTGEVLTELILEGESAEGVAFSPDGERIAVATMNPDARSLQVFDSVLDEELLAVFFDFEGIPRFDRNFEPAFSPDGGSIAIGLDDGTARVLDVATGKELFSFIHTSDPWDKFVIGVAFDPRGRRLAVSGTDDMLSTWDMETGDQIFVVDIGTELYVAFSPDGELIAASHKVLDSETGEDVLTLSGPLVGYQAAFMPDGQRLVTDGIAHDVLAWDISPSAELWTTQVAAAGAGGNRLAMSLGGEYLVSGDDSGWITLLDAVSGEVLWAAQGHQDWVGGLSFNEDGTRLATGADDGQVLIWDTQEGITLTQWTAHDAWVNDVELSPDGDRLATASNDQSIKFWDVSSGELLATHDLPHNIPGMSMHPDGKLLASSTQMDGTISLWDFETGESAGELLSPQWGILGTEFSPDGEVLFSGTPGGTVIAWDVANKEQLYVLDHGIPVMGLATSPDGRLLAVTAPWDDKLFLWDLDRTELLWQIPLPWIGRVEISPDGRTLYVSSIFAEGLEDPVVRALTLDIDTLTAIAESRLTRDFTDDECRRYRIDPCPSEQ